MAPLLAVLGLAFVLGVLPVAIAVLASAGNPDHDRGVPPAPGAGDRGG